MAVAHGSETVIDVPRERLDEAADVLARAFATYPLMLCFFEDAGAGLFRNVRETFRLTCEGRMGNGDPVKGVVHDGRLVAVTCAEGPERKPWPESMAPSAAAFAEHAGEQALTRLDQYGEMVAAHRPLEPHFYLICIGVLPEAQGQGCGRALMDYVHALSAAHPTSTGVGLDTETPDNVPLYEHCGYRVAVRSELGNVPIWFMFRPNTPTL